MRRTGVGCFETAREACFSSSWVFAVKLSNVPLKCRESSRPCARNRGFREPARLVLLGVDTKFEHAGCSDARLIVIFAGSNEELELPSALPSPAAAAFPLSLPPFGVEISVRSLLKEYTDRSDPDEPPPSPQFPSLLSFSFYFIVVTALDSCLKRLVASFDSAGAAWPEWKKHTKGVDSVMKTQHTRVPPPLSRIFCSVVRSCWSCVTWVSTARRKIDSCTNPSRPSSSTRRRWVLLLLCAEDPSYPGRLRLFGFWWVLVAFSSVAFLYDGEDVKKKNDFHICRLFYVFWKNTAYNKTIFFSRNNALRCRLASRRQACCLKFELLLNCSCFV